MGDRFRAKDLVVIFLSPVSRARNDVDYDTQGSARPAASLHPGLHAATRFAGCGCDADGSCKGEVLALNFDLVFTDGLTDTDMSFVHC